MLAVKEANTPEELAAILQLRYKMLRQPWNQPLETATDQLEQSSVNAFIEADGQAVACGRLQENEHHIGQVRFMAVDGDWQGKGLGKDILRFLETKGLEMGLTKIELQARENALAFYKSCGYIVKETSFLLWGQIQHYLMEKVIQKPFQS